VVPAPDGVRRRSTRARPTDDDLLDAAAEVFAAHGYAATTMSAVAEHCDSTKPTLYAHFGDKDALHTRLMRREAELCRATLVAAYDASAGGDLRQQVEADTRALFAYADDRPSGFALLFGGDLTLPAVRIREELLSAVEDRLAERVHGYLRDRGAVVDDAGPGRVERQLAAVLAGVALSAARHALRHEVPHDEACTLAVDFSVAALTHLDPTV